MKSSVLKTLLCTVSLLLIAPMFPAGATESPIIDYCGKKSSGKVRPITQGSCTAKELSLGTAPIIRGEKRPEALHPMMKARYLTAKAAAKKKGHSLTITSGYRSYARQKYLYERAVKRYGSAAKASKWVLPPKKSNHPWGLAVDINYGVSGIKAKKSATWLENNGYKYGLCRRYANEWWHFEPLVAPGTKCPKMEPYAS